MKAGSSKRIGLKLVLALAAASQMSMAQINVPTERYDNNRTGANLAETQLTTSSVNPTHFGKVWSWSVSGSVQAQPLYLTGVTMPNKVVRNLVFVATMNDVVYAFDADSSVNTPLWKVDLTQQTPMTTPVPVVDVTGDNFLNIVGNVGIESTPVIDTTTGTIYLVARTKTNGQYFQKLHALSILNGAEKFGGPVVISGSVPGTGVASSGGMLAFDPLMQNQRSSLALANGQVLLAWASHEDIDPYHGWVMSYDAATLKQTGIFQTTPSGDKGGVWMSGHAPAVDAAGNAYYISGNGDWDGTANFGESMLKFGTGAGQASRLNLVDWFTPDNYANLNAGDADLGSSGPILLPGTDLLVGGGKQSVLYVMHTTTNGQMGHEQTGNGQIVQNLYNNGGEIKGGPVYWNRAGGLGPWLYVWSNGGDYLKAYHFNGATLGTFNATPVSQSAIPSASGASGGVLTLSANGSKAGTGIVWSSMPLTDDGDHGVHQGVLRALNADDLKTELWDSQMVAARDGVGLWPKYAPPLVVNGRVYMASFAADGVGNSLVSVFGLLHPTFTMAATPLSRVVKPGGKTTFALTVTPLTGFNGAVSLSVSGLPRGATGVLSTAGLPKTSTLTVNTSYLTPVGSYPLVVTGVSGTGSAVTRIPLALALVVTAVGPGLGTISIDLVGNGTAMNKVETAGVVPRANWNEAMGGASTAELPLVDETGTRTAAKATWTSGTGANVWRLPIADAPGNTRMMAGYLDPLGGTATVMVQGLPVSPQGYDVYVYADGDNGGAARTGSYQIAGAGITTTTVNLTDAANANYAGKFVRAANGNGNYVRFTVQATGFTVTATPGATTDGAPRSPLNGVQIVPRDSVVAGPVFSPPAGSYPIAQNVVLESGVSGTVLYYTTNGTVPTTASTKYVKPIAVSGSTTVRAIAVAGGYSSLVTSASYVIAKP